MPPIVGVIVLLCLVTGFGVLLVWGTSKLGPKLKANISKESSYECGLEPAESEENRVSIRFYLTAILFVLFDIEIIFLVPWAINYKEQVAEGRGFFMFTAMLIFVLVFTFGLFWEVKSKALKWN